MTTPTDVSINRGARAVALAGRIGLRGYDRPAAAAQPNDAVSREIPSTDDRASAILALPEARGRPAAARHAAYKTDMSVSEAQAYLAVGNPSPRPAATITAPAATVTALPVNRGERAVALAGRIGLRGFQ